MQGYILEMLIITYVVSICNNLKVYIKLYKVFNVIYEQYTYNIHTIYNPAIFYILLIASRSRESSSCV